MAKKKNAATNNEAAKTKEAAKNAAETAQETKQETAQETKQETEKPAEEKAAKKASKSAKGKEIMSYRDMSTALRAVKEESISLNAWIRNVCAILKSETGADSEVKIIADMFGITADMSSAERGAVRLNIINAVMWHGDVDGVTVPCVIRSQKNACGATVSVVAKATSWHNALRLVINRRRKGLKDVHHRVTVDRTYSFEAYKRFVSSSRF